MYASKIGIYQGDCKILLGKYEMFSEYIEEFSKIVNGTGLDIGAGPGGVNGKFFKHCVLDGCDIEKEVVDSLSSLHSLNNSQQDNNYSKTFVHDLSKDVFPYTDNSLDFVICSCMIQHLNTTDELKYSLSEINRILKKDGKLYLMYKAGSDSFFTHFNQYYKENRTFHVFSPDTILKLTTLTLTTSELLLDDNWIPYCCSVFCKF